MNFFIILGVSGVLLACKLVKNELEIVKNYPQNAKNEHLNYLTGPDTSPLAMYVDR